MSLSCRALLLALLFSSLAVVASPVPLPQGTGPGADESDLGKCLAALEYHLSPAPGGGLTAPSRGQGLRTIWRAGAVEVTPRKGADWTVRWSVSRVGRFNRDGAFVSRDIADVLQETVAGPRIDWRREGIREWWINGPLGVEQFVEIAERPAGAARRPVVLEASLRGVTSATRTTGGGLDFAGPTGEDILSLHPVTVLDARGAAVPAWMDWNDGVLSLSFDDRGAQYPVVLDPLMTSPQATIRFNQNGATIGFAVASAGDVNGDGFGDVLVGAPYWDGGQTDEGAAFVHLGGPSGIDPLPAWRAEANFGAAYLGTGVAGGDVNGDGYDDILVGAPNYTRGTTNDGSVFLWLGGPSGTGNTTGLGAFGTPINADWSAYGGQRDAQFGASVAFASGVLGDRDPTVLGGEVPGDGGHPVLGDDDQAGGYQEAIAGAVNPGGYDAVLVGAPKQSSGAPGAAAADGAAFAWFGGPSSPANPSGLGPTGLNSNADWKAGGLQNQSNFGVAVASAGDVNGDGWTDVIVGADFYDAPSSSEGRAFVFMGPLPMPTAPAWTAESNQTSAQFGRAVAGDIDVNCDGYDDIIVGVPFGAGRVTPATFREGWVGVWYGGASTGSNPSGLGDLGTQGNADWTAEAEVAGARFGWSIGAVPPHACDPCGGSVLVGAPFFKLSGLTARGGAFAWASEGGLGPDGRALVNSDWAMTGAVAGNQAGYSVAGLEDVNGDGSGDVIVGLPYAKGSAVASGGEAQVFLSLPDDVERGCCRSDADCDDGDPCTDDICEAGTCYHEEVSCDDKDPCTKDFCDSANLGFATANGPPCVHLPRVCDDNNPCTEDSCDDRGVCQHLEVSCDDGDPCTDDRCVGATVQPGPGDDHTCLHVPVNCDDSNPCTDDFCDERGTCQHLEVSCDDGDPCTDDRCVGTDGVTGTSSEPTCLHEPVNCDDADPCTDDSCDESGVCQHAAVDCDDGDPCTDDRCSGSALAPGLLPEPNCEHTPVNCDDSDPCTDDSCDESGVCQHDAVDCDDGDPCTDDICVPDDADGTLTGPSARFGRGYTCTHPPVDCDDMDACTIDECEARYVAFGDPGDPGDTPCTHRPLCDDGIACTEDACFDGACANQSTCNDSDPCTIDSCSPNTGECSFSTMDCDDMDACTTDGCAAGVCTHDEVDCDDENACTNDTCDTVLGCQYSEVECTPLRFRPDGCINVSCDPVLGCQFEQVSCDDGNPCTDDSCNGDCVHENNTASCDDDDLCTISDTCAAGECVGTPFICVEDGNPCTDEYCESGECFPTNNTSACDDLDACTDGDTCSEGECVGEPVNCDDGNLCTDDSCVGGPGIQLFGTIDDVCMHAPVNCDDGNSCTDDSCEPATGCVYAAVTCDDMDLCTDDTCDAGTGCVYTPITCDDLDLCTDDTCDPSTGCVYTPVSCGDLLKQGGASCFTCDPEEGCLPGCDDGNPDTCDQCMPDGTCTHCLFGDASCCGG